MSEFRTDLQTQLLDSNGSWILLAPLVYYSSLLCMTITVPKGFRTDYASVPRLPLIYALFGDTSHKAAVIHDYLYAVRRTTRAEADAIFREAAEASGVGFFRRNLMYYGVRLGGKLAWESKDDWNAIK